MELDGETPYGSLVLLHSRSILTTVLLPVERILLKLDRRTWSSMNACKNAKTVQNAVPSNGMLTNGRERLASISLQASKVIEL